MKNLKINEKQKIEKIKSNRGNVVILKSRSSGVRPAYSGISPAKGGKSLLLRKVGNPSISG